MKRMKSYAVKTVLLFFALILVNVFAQNFTGQIDLTEDKRYTISPATKNLLRNIDEPIEIFVFLQDKNSDW